MERGNRKSSLENKDRKKRVKIQYRFYERNNDNNNQESLSHLICTALDYKENNSSLRERSGLRIMQYDDAVMILNRCDEKKDWVFGELASFKPGEHIKVIEDALDQKMVNFEQIGTPEGRHPLRGVTYWLVIHDHILIIQASNIPINSIKKYFNWLICEKSGLLPNTFTFGAQIAVDNQNAPPINQIEIRPKNLTDSNKKPGHSPAPTTRDIIRDESETEISENSTIFDILRAAGFGEEKIETLRQKAGDDGEILLDLAIKIKRKGRSIPLTFADAASLISEIEEDEVILRGKHGKQVGKLIMLSYSEARVREMGSLLDPDGALDALIEAYKFFLRNRYIEGNIEL